MEKINIYQERDFGDIFSASINFMKQNFHVIGRFMLYIILPTCLLLGIFTNGVYSEMGSTNPDPSGIILKYPPMILIFGIGSLLICGFVFTLIKFYIKSKDSIEGLQLKELWPAMIPVMGKCIITGIITIIAMTLLVLILVAFCAISSYTIIITLPAFFICLFPITLFFPIYILEENTDVWNAFGKAYRLGFSHFWVMIGVIIITFIAIALIQGICSIPYYIAFIIKTYFFNDGENVAIIGSGFYSFLVYILSVIACFGHFISSAIELFVIIYLYGSFAEKEDHVMVEQEIDSFDNLSDEKKSDDINNFDSI